MAHLRFVQQMDDDIVEKVAEEVAAKEDELIMEIDRLISEASGYATENVMESIKKETGWDLNADETAYSEINTEFEDKMRIRLGLE